MGSHTNYYRIIESLIVLIVDEILKGDVTPWQAVGLIHIYVALGEKDEAFKWLNHPP